MAKRIPIQVCKDIVKKYDQSQAILVTWDRKSNITNVVTYGKTLDDAEQAAKGGNNIKKILRFPEDMCNSIPSKIKRRNKKKKETADRDG